MSDVVYVVLAYHSDGSGLGEETVLAVYRDKQRAERVIALMTKVGSHKELCIAERGIEQ